MRFAVEGDPLAATRRAINRRYRCEAGGEGDGERKRIEFAEEPLQRRLVGRDAIREAERSEDRGGLTLPPLGNGEDREMIGKQGGDGEGEDGSEGESVCRAGGGDRRRTRRRRRDGGATRQTPPTRQDPADPVASGREGDIDCMGRSLAVDPRVRHALRGEGPPLCPSRISHSENA